jgi:hypothetical protein
LIIGRAVTGKLTCDQPHHLCSQPLGPLGRIERYVLAKRRGELLEPPCERPSDQVITRSWPQIIALSHMPKRTCRT